MATIYDMLNGVEITTGLQSRVFCDETIQAARRIAAKRRHSIIVDDDGTVYRVTPAGYVWRAPASWRDAEADR